MNPDIEKYLIEKYGPDYAKRAESAHSEQTDRSNMASVASSFGNALAGRSNAASDDYYAQQKKDSKENTIGRIEADKKSYMDQALQGAQLDKSKREAALSDPKSQASMTFRKNLAANFPRIAEVYGADFENVSAADQESIFKPLQLREQIEARKESARLAAGTRRDALDLKASEKSDKKKQQMHEIEDRRQNINASLDALDKMIEEDGTWEAFGSHNQDLDRLIESVATDMAKLQDPQSVARPQEVEMIKKSLVQSGFQNANSTARDILKNFKGEVARRADGAYKVRGLDIPGQGGQALPETKVVGGKTYQKVQGGWQEITSVGKR